MGMIRKQQIIQLLQCFGVVLILSDLGVVVQMVDSFVIIKTNPVTTTKTTTSTVREQQQVHQRRNPQQQKQESQYPTRTLPFSSSSSNSRNTILFGINEWRDKMFDYLPGSTFERRIGLEYAVAPPKEICILPFSFHEVLIQGECKQLRLYEDRFQQLFNYSLHEHCGVVAMGLLADSGLVQTVPLCEIEAYNNMNSPLGIFVTIRVIGRAKLIDITQQTPYIKAVCEEIVDTIPPNLELPNLVASNIENLIVLISSMEHRYEMGVKNQLKNKQDDNDTNSTSSNSGSSNRIEEEPEDTIMKRRIQIAKLEDTFYDNDDDMDGDDNDDEDDDEEEETEMIDRTKRFRRAYEIALQTDTQGYQVPMNAATTTIITPTTTGSTNSSSISSWGSTSSSSSSTIAQQSLSGLLSTPLRSARELTALSWATYCTDLLPDITTITFRIQALDCNNLFDRLTLGLQMLRNKKENLQKKLKRNGLLLKNDNDYIIQKQKEQEQEKQQQEKQKEINDDSSEEPDTNDYDKGSNI